MSKLRNSRGKVTSKSIRKGPAGGESARPVGTANDPVAAMQHWAARLPSAEGLASIVSEVKRIGERLESLGDTAIVKRSIAALLYETEPASGRTMPRQQGINVWYTAYVKLRRESRVADILGNISQTLGKVVFPRDGKSRPSPQEQKDHGRTLQLLADDLRQASGLRAIKQDSQGAGFAAADKKASSGGDLRRPVTPTVASHLFLLTECRRLVDKWPDLYHVVIEAEFDDWSGPNELDSLVHPALPAGVRGCPFYSGRFNIAFGPGAWSCFVCGSVGSCEEACDSHMPSVGDLEAFATEVVKVLTLVPANMVWPISHSAQFVQHFSDAMAVTQAPRRSWGMMACLLGYVYCALSPQEHPVTFWDTADGTYKSPRHYCVRGLPHSVFHSCELALNRMAASANWHREPFPRWTFVPEVPRFHVAIRPKPKAEQSSESQEQPKAEPATREEQHYQPLAARRTEEPNLLWWDGRRYELPPVQWRLLNALWQEHRRTLDDVAEAVWSQDVRDDRIRSACSKLNRQLAERSLPLSVSIKSGWVILDIQQ